MSYKDFTDAPIPTCVWGHPIATPPTSVEGETLLLRLGTYLDGNYPHTLLVPVPLKLLHELHAFLAARGAGAEP